MEKQKENPSEELKITVGKNQYEIKFPDTGQLIDIEKAKSRLAYPSSATDASLWAYNLSVAIETFKILIPKLQDDLNVKDFYKLSLMESRELVLNYIKVYKPWFDSWMEIIVSVLDDAENS